MPKVIVAIVFGTALAGALLGADAFNQYQKARVSNAPFSAAAYIDSITARVQSAKAERAAAAEAQAIAQALAERRKLPAKSFLPEPIAGWQRRDWQDGDAALLSAGTDGGMDMSLMAEAHEVDIDLSNPLTIKSKVDAHRRNTTWVYQQGDDFVVLSASLSKAPRGNARQTAAMNVALSNIQAMDVQDPWGVLGGVVWTSAMNLSGKDGAEKVLRLKADLGGEVTLRATARTSDDSLRSLLAAVDYEGLNGLLSAPLADVRNDFPIMPVAEQIAWGKAWLRTERAEAAEKHKALQSEMEAAFQLTPLEKAAVSVLGGSGSVAASDDQAALDSSGAGVLVAEGGDGDSLVGGLMSMFDAKAGEAVAGIETAEQAEDVSADSTGFMARLFGSSGAAEAAEDAAPAGDTGKPVVVNRLVNRSSQSGCGSGTFCKAPGAED